LIASGPLSPGSRSTLQADSFDDSNFGEQDGELVATGSSTSINLRAVIEANGKPIDGDANGNAGGNFTCSFTMSVSRGITYRTADGDVVKLSVRGPGEIFSLLPAASSASIITLTGTNAASSILTGKLREGRKSLGYVVLDQWNATPRRRFSLIMSFM